CSACDSSLTTLF
nr:immunoglobulin light chain junction region [Macaca mulatta]